MLPAQSLPLATTVTRVFVIARPDFRIDGLISLLDASAEHEVISCALPGQRCWQQIQHTRPDVLLIQRESLAQPVSDTLQQGRLQAGGTPLLLFGEPLPETEIDRLIRAGSQGYISNDTPTPQLLRALRCVAIGEIWTERRVLENIVRGGMEIERLIEDSMLERIEEMAADLTERERQVFLEVLNGASTREIANTLHLSQQGVKLHLGRIYAKFDVSNRTQLVLEAYRRVTPAADLPALFQQSLVNSERSRLATPASLY